MDAHLQNKLKVTLTLAYIFLLCEIVVLQKFQKHNSSKSTYHLIKSD